MTRLAAAEIGADVSDLEIRRGGTSYTADTLAEFSRMYPNDTLWFIMGTDMFLTVQNWVRPAEIFALARIAVVLREDHDAARVKAHKAELEQTFSCNVDLVDAKAHPISSTELRENVLDEEHQMYLPKSVLDYIKEHRFYLSEEK